MIVKVASTRRKPRRRILVKPKKSTTDRIAELKKELGISCSPFAQIAYEFSKLKPLNV